jgi:hypothetical protein
MYFERAGIHRHCGWFQGNFARRKSKSSIITLPEYLGNVGERASFEKRVGAPQILASSCSLNELRKSFESI